MPTHGKTKQRFCGKKCYMIDYERRKTERRRAEAPEKEVLPEGQKRCGACGEVKVLEDFARRSNSADGRQHRCRACQQEWQHENPEKRRASWNRYRKATYLIKTYGITPEFYQLLWEEQGKVCAICKRPGGDSRDNRQPLHVDHDHACCPGKITCGKCIRGLLCKPCNTMLGNAEDDPATLLAAYSYLKPDPPQSTPVVTLRAPIDTLVAQLVRVYGAEALTEAVAAATVTT
jgi:hypothetical protein